MRSFTSSSKSAKSANARSNRTGKSVPTAGYAWRRTAQAAAIRCRRPVRMPALGVAWHYPRDSPETLVYNPARPMEQKQQTVAQLRGRKKKGGSGFDDRMRQAEEQRRQMRQEFHQLCHEHWQSSHEEAAASAQHILQSVQERRRMVHTTTAYSRTGKVGPLVLTASNVFAPEQEYAMAEQKCPTCHEKGTENRLSMSRGQQ